MKLLYTYTLDYIKRNRRSSLAIMVAILMTSTMLSALCGYLYNMYTDNLRYILKENGDWHGELFDSTAGDKLDIIENFDSIEATMIKGQWKLAKIDDPRRDYLIWRDANAAYWESMPEGDSAIIEGHAPAASGEIALSKQYFEHHPNLNLGDSITLPTGGRTAANGSPIELLERRQEGEQFAKEGEITLTVVGKLDVTTSSTVPAYTALGFLEPEQISQKDDLTIYFRFHNIGDTYKELPKIAAAVGYQPDEYGHYLLRYNTDYLIRKLVLAPDQISVMNLFIAGQMPLMFAVIGFLTVAIFVLVIHNAFALSTGARLSQLGILASVGATPKQIKRSVVLEALLLTIVPLPLGLLFGQLAVKVMLDFINNAPAASQNQLSLAYKLGWQSLLPSILLTLITVWWSALIPARKISKLPPIAAIRQGGVEKLKKPRRFGSLKSFGLMGELADNALQARKKSYRTATVSLTLSFLTLACFLTITSASTTSREVYQTDAKKWENQDILVRLDNVSTQEDFNIITEQIGAQKDVVSSTWYNTLRAATWIPSDGFSKDFLSAGGFESASKFVSQSQLPLLRDEQRRVDSILVGIDDASFAAYCTELGLDPFLFHQTDQWRGILYNTIGDITTSTKRDPVNIPYLDVIPGDTLTFTEKTMDDYEGDFTFPMEITALASHMPTLGNVFLGNRYDSLYFMPMSRVTELSRYFFRSNTTKLNGTICTENPEQIPSARGNISDICEAYFGSGDYEVTGEDEYFIRSANGQELVGILFGFVSGLLAIIGLSNAWSTVLGTLMARRREFSMLRSVGLSPKGVIKMLTLEALLLGIKPILFSLPLIAVLQWIFLYVNELSVVEWLPFAPWAPILLYTLAVLSVTIAAYAVGARRLLHENIIEGIKQEFI